MQKIFTRHSVMIISLTALWLLAGWRLWTPNAQDRQIFLQESDFTLHYYGPISQHIERFQRGEFMQWNPYNRAGFPQVANIQDGEFYFPRYIIAAIVGGSGWTIQDFQFEVMAHVWLTSVLMYAFINRLFRDSPHARWFGLFGAIAWGYSGYMTSYPLLHVTILETVTWLPLAFLGIEIAFTPHRNWFWGVFIANLSVMLLVFAGHPQMMLYSVYAIGLYGLYSGWRNGLSWLSTLTRCGLSIGIGIGLAAIQLLPTLELVGLSSRAVNQSFADKSVGFDLTVLPSLVWSAGQGIWSPLYVGVIVVFLAAVAVYRPSRDGTFWAGLAGLGLLVSFGGLTIAYQAAYLLAPGMSVFRNQERLVFIVIFALIILACHGLNQLSEKNTSQENRPIRLAGYAIVGLLGLALFGLETAAVLGASITHERLQALSWAVIIGIGLVVWLGRYRENAPAGFILIIVLVSLDLLTVGAGTPSRVADVPKNRLKLDSSLQAYQSPDPTQVMWRVDGSGGVQGTADYFRIPDIYGNGPLALDSIEKLFTLPVDRFWEIFAVRYATIIDPPPANVSLNLVAYGRNASGAEFQVVELLNPRPLAHLVYDYRQAEGSAEFARQIMADNNINLREQAITLYPLPFELPVTRPTVSQVTDVRWLSPEHLAMQVSSGADALLTLSVVNYPGWTARVNGQLVETVNVYAGLIGVPLRAGENQQVELTFESASLRLGMLISLLSGGVLLGVMVWGLLGRRLTSKPTA